MIDGWSETCPVRRERERAVGLYCQTPHYEYNCCLLPTSFSGNNCSNVHTKSMNFGILLSRNISVFDSIRKYNYIALPVIVMTFCSKLLYLYVNKCLFRVKSNCFYHILVCTPAVAL